VIPTPGLCNPCRPTHGAYVRRHRETAVADELDETMARSANTIALRNPFESALEALARAERVRGRPSRRPVLQSRSGVEEDQGVPGRYGTSHNAPGSYCPSATRFDVWCRSTAGPVPDPTSRAHRSGRRLTRHQREGIPRMKRFRRTWLPMVERFSAITDLDRPAQIRIVARFTNG